MQKVEERKGRTFQETLRAVREKHNVSMGKLARHMRVSIPYICDVEHGRRPPFTPERIQQLASLVGAEDAEALMTSAMATRPVELPPSTSETKARLALVLAHGWNDLPDHVALEMLKKAVEALKDDVSKLGTPTARKSPARKTK